MKTMLRRYVDYIKNWKFEQSNENTTPLTKVLNVVGNHNTFNLNSFFATHTSNQIQSFELHVYFLSD